MSLHVCMTTCKYRQLQVNPHSATCTDEINSASNIQGIEAKNKIYSSFQLKWVASWFSAFANAAALVECFDIGRLHDRMHFPNKHCLFYLLSYATCVFCKILCLKNEKSLFEGDFISLHHFGLNLRTQIMRGCGNHCFRSYLY